MTMNWATDEQRFSELTEDSKHLLRQLWVVKAETVCRWGQFRRFEEIKADLVRLPIDSGVFSTFISHRWETSSSPDPNRNQYHALSDWTSFEQNTYYWYDYSCMPRNPTSDEDGAYIEFILQNLNEIVRASKMLILRMPADNYFSRGWCFFEWFTAQYTGMFDRNYVVTESRVPGESDRSQQEILQAKRQADALFCGDYGMLPKLSYSKRSDRDIVSRLTIRASMKCQRMICASCIEFICKVVDRAKDRFPMGLRVTVDDIHERYRRLVMFIKIWTQVLQSVEPVSDRIAMFMQKGHWDDLVHYSQPIAIDLLRLEYRVSLRDEEILPADRQLREVYEYCQMKMPDARYAVTAFMCFFLMGYDYHEDIPDAQHRTAEQCGLISQEFLDKGRYAEAETYAQAQLRKAHLEFDDAQTEKALSKLGRIHRNVGNLSEAAKFYTRSLNLSQQMCDKRSEAIAIDQIGGLRLRGGDPAEAIEYYNKSLALHEKLGNLLDIGVEFGNIGSAYLHLSEFKKAKEMLEKAIEYSTQVEDFRNLSIWYFNLGQVHEQTEHSHDARDSYEKSWILNKLVGNAQLDSILRVKIGLQDG